MPVAALAPRAHYASLKRDESDLSVAMKETAVRMAPSLPSPSSKISIPRPRTPSAPGPARAHQGGRSRKTLCPALQDARQVFASFQHSSYVAPIAFGDGSSTFHLQVDTGSSDLAGVQSSFSGLLPAHAARPCARRPAIRSLFLLSHRPSQDLKFASGEASGPIVWDSVQLGGYQISNQAFGSRTVPSVLGIGRHPSSLVHDPSKIQYDTIVPLSKPSWWKAHISGITVHVDGQDKPVSLSGNTPGSDAGKPTAILDTGVPIILATQAIANGFTCLGFIQTPQQFPGLSASINNAADIILGVPFLRNPLPDGTFPRNSQDLNQAGARGRTWASSGSPTPPSPRLSSTRRGTRQAIGLVALHSTPSPMKGLSIGVKVVIGFAGFFGLCILLFGGRWLWMRRKYGDDPPRRARRTPSLGEDDGTLTEDELRQRRFEDYRRKNSASYYSADTALTMVESNSSDRRKTYIRGNPDEFGALVPLASSRTLSGTGTRASYLDGWDDSTYVDDAARRDNMASQTPMLPASGMDLADIADLIDSASPTRASFAGVGSGSASLRSPRPRSGAGPGAGVRASLALSPSPIGEEPPPTLRSPLRQAHAVPDDTPRALVDVLPSPPPPTLVAQEAP
ncbi:uncharacterized protein BXZ73DRAFT_80421 [Epithele typhae]|uniref:uncharacterized protein n=1 Tax=Epithele typhae TaxID=378194 RepID=UPI002007E61D|nr:uncharacterized protein BXZ73DRAFT_80421 [Epithele typhae]KAH9919211.1 hypothetical protein BXZ73DRAFT_80421 [Epithele typhae]